MFRLQERYFLFDCLFVVLFLSPLLFPLSQDKSHGSFLCDSKFSLVVLKGAGGWVTMNAARSALWKVSSLALLHSLLCTNSKVTTRLHGKVVMSQTKKP